MKKGKLFLIIVSCGVLGILSASWAQAGSRWERVTLRDDADVAEVRVYGPDALTDLAETAILEKRPNVAVTKQYKPLKNKVYIEGTTGSGYMALSPKRVGIVKAAIARGDSAYSALCTEQQGVIQRTVGPEEKVVRRVERKVYRTRYYVQPVCLPPAPVVYATPAVGFVGYYPYYSSYRGYWGWRGRHGYYPGRAGFQHYRHGGYHHGHHRGGRR